MREGELYTETTCGPQSPKYFTIWPFYRKNCPPLNKPSGFLFIRPLKAVLPVKSYYKFVVEAIRKVLSSLWNSN